MTENVRVRLLEEILGEITALEREVSRPLLNQVQSSERLNGTTGKYLSQETRNNIRKSFSCRMANRLQTSLPTGSNFWSAEL